MAISFTKTNLSGSTNGRPISVTSVAVTGATIHTTASQTDEVWLWGMSTATQSLRFVIEWGGTATGDTVNYDIPAAGAGPTLLVPGWLLTASLVVRGYATQASIISVAGYVNRISVT